MLTISWISQSINSRVEKGTGERIKMMKLAFFRFFFYFSA
ncbi:MULTISPECIES: pheST operon leader peptide PheM [unclassified Xenorhabdus]|nr:pheST operon leader peptide PheM [Xenorhabdus sp. PB30.3]